MIVILVRAQFPSQAGDVLKKIEGTNTLTMNDFDIYVGSEGAAV